MLHGKLANRTDDYRNKAETNIMHSPVSKFIDLEVVSAELAEKRREFREQDTERRKANRAHLSGLQPNGTWKHKREIRPKRNGGANLSAWFE